VVVPEEGMQAIPEQLASRLSPNQIRLQTRVAKIEGKIIYLENGDTISAQTIVFATDANTTSRFLGESETTRYNSTDCLYFACDSPYKLFKIPYLISMPTKMS